MWILIFSGDEMCYNGSTAGSFTAQVPEQNTEKRCSSSVQRRYLIVSEQHTNHTNSSHSASQGQGGAPRPRKHQKQKQDRGKRIALNVLKVLGTLFLIGLTTGALLLCFFAVYVQTNILPNAHVDTDDFSIGENSVMYYMNQETGKYEPLVTLLSSTNSIWVDYEDLPQNLLDAAVAIEDRRFYTHSGVDWKRTAAAVLYMMTGQDIQGGSTITQQLIKNITSDDDVTVKRKITEIFRALEFDANHEKSEILTWYLNIIYLGEGCVGVGSASYEYFGKPVSELSLAECASLIAVTNNPSVYSPYGTLRVTNQETGEVKTSQDYNKERQLTILYQMLDQKLITKEEYDAAVAEELQFVRAPGETDTTTIYSWYEELVIKDVVADLMKLGYNSKTANILLSSGGLSIYTCLNPEIQAMAESIYNDRSNLNYTSPSGTQQLQSAITIIDNSTGDLVAVVGQVGEKTGNLWHSYATDSRRQPGSSIKPLSVYAPALEMGLTTPYSVVDDYPYQILGGSAWPVNVDGVYRGLVTVKEAVTNSYNTVAVRVLSDMVTPAASFQFMEERFHIDLEEGREVEGRYVTDVAASPLALGGLTDGVSPRDMATAYATFPNGGIYRVSRTYTQVVRSDGTVLLDNQMEEEVALKTSTAYYINDMLTSVVSSGSGTAARLNNMAVAGKTGTTDSKYDRWFVGYTPYYTAAVWIGYADRNERVTAPGNPAVNMWQKVMSQVHSGLDYRSFTKPNNLTTYSYCQDSGLLATDYCRQDPRGDRIATGSALRDDVPTQYCTCHTEESTVTACVDSPIYNSSGEPTGLYHLAGEFCPEESLRQITLVSFDRQIIAGIQPRDYMFHYVFTEAAGTCEVHTEAKKTDPLEGEDPNITDPDDPNGDHSSSGDPPDDSSQNGGGNSGGTDHPDDIPTETGLPPGY